MSNKQGNKLTSSNESYLSVFDFIDYKKFIQSVIDKKIIKNLTRSFLGKILNCHGAYISQVLNGTSQLSPEQGLRLTRFLNLDHEDTKFFLLLLQIERAGTVDLKKHLEEERSKMIQGHRLLKNRISIPATLSEEAQSIYYNSWLYGAIHVALSIPGLNDEASLSKYFKVSIGQVRRILDFLAKQGIAIRSTEGEKCFYMLGTTSVHLGSDSPHITKHHANWRLKCAETLESVDEDDLHYSGVFSVSVGTASVIRELLTREIKKCLDKVKDSQDEQVMALNIDFFHVGQGGGST